MPQNNEPSRPEAPPPSYLTTQAAAQALGVDMNYIRRLLADGKLRGRKVENKSLGSPEVWEIEAGSVEEYRKIQKMRAEVRERTAALKGGD